jgi:putative oxidoreductase
MTVASRPGLDGTRLLRSRAPATAIVLRVMVGAVFLSEGLQKFLFADQLGAGRFARIGLPAPELLGPFVGGVEVVCGVLVLAGCVTRLAVVPLLAIMVVAIASTKVPILLERGFWPMAHEARTDWSMALASAFLLIEGGGPWSVDRWLLRRLKARNDRGTA